MVAAVRAEHAASTKSAVLVANVNQAAHQIAPARSAAVTDAPGHAARVVAAKCAPLTENAIPRERIRSEQPPDSDQSASSFR